jgi:hypothetical protein
VKTRSWIGVGPDGGVRLRSYLQSSHEDEESSHAEHARTAQDQRSTGLLTAPSAAAADA